MNTDASGRIPNAPFSTVLLFVALACILASVHSLGVTHVNVWVSAGGYAGLIVTAIGACNICHRMGFRAGRQGESTPSPEVD